MFSCPMITGAPLSGCLNIFTSVPQIPATSIRSSALSSEISGIANSRTSIVLGPTFTAAATFSTFDPLGSRLSIQRFRAARSVFG